MGVRSAARGAEGSGCRAGGGLGRGGRGAWRGAGGGFPPLRVEAARIAPGPRPFRAGALGAGPARVTRRMAHLPGPLPSRAARTRHRACATLPPMAARAWMRVASLRHASCRAAHGSALRRRSRGARSREPRGKSPRAGPRPEPPALIPPLARSLPSRAGPGRACREWGAQAGAGGRRVRGSCGVLVLVPTISEREED